MSGEEERGGAKPGQNPFFDEADAPRPPPRARRHKPPPLIITAGGVDMARGHASGIKVREGAPPPPSAPDETVAVRAPRPVAGQGGDPGQSSTAMSGKGAAGKSGDLIQIVGP